MQEFKQFNERFVVFMVGWILLVCASFTWNAWQSWQSVLEEGRSEGRMAFVKDISYRMWNSSHGGVYVPDAWEKESLSTFEKDHGEITQYTEIDGEPFLRFMRPMITTEECLKCHGYMGYKVGDIRGGISISIPMAPYISDLKKTIVNLLLTHSAILISGLGFLVFTRRKVMNYFLANQRSLEQINEERERLLVTLRSIGDGVITTDLDGKVVLINKITEQLTGWSLQSAIGRPIAEVFTIINRKTGVPCSNPVDKVLSSGRIIGLANHTALIAKDGTHYIIEDSGAPIYNQKSEIIGTVLVFRDVTEKRRTAKELLKVEKLESVGILAGGIAHDFNNILAAILGNIELAWMSIDSTSKAYPLLQEAKKASLRAKDLTQQLLTFSKGGSPVKKTTPVGKAIVELVNFLLHGSSVVCRFDIPDNLWLVDIDLGQINQVLQNLVINARDAMPDGGEIKIGCANIADLRSEPPLGLADGAYIKITVQDNGCGIANKDLEKIFDPYFTMKQRGNGLGLAITYSIISKHDGHIAVESVVGEGTKFTIYLPASEQQMIKEPIIALPKTKISPARILVMDDNKQVQDIAKQMFACLGHEVLLAGDGKEAITIFTEQRNLGQPVDLIIMDLTIPGGMGGKEAIGEILKIDQEAKVAVSSGYSNDPVMADYQQYGFRAAIAKPFMLAELTQVITDVVS